MRRTDVLCVILISILLAAVLGCSPAAPPPVQVDAVKLKMFKPLPAEMDAADHPITADKVTLGRMLYYEPRLSKGQEVSCNTCHILTSYGVDSKPVSTGHKGHTGDRNSPTVFHAAGHFVQFWDGRAPTVEEQAKGPVMNPVEMAMPTEKQVVAVLSSMPEYVDLFKRAFPDAKNPISFDNMANAIGAFERKLITPSRWDKFLQGDQAALTNEEKAGFNKYMEVGCQACHAGTYLGGNLYQKLGAVVPWPNQKDPGRFKVTKQESDMMMFKVPSLRNIEKTAPYYHDGSVPTLEEAVRMMGEYQLGKTLSDADVASIVTFLKSLTGELPLDYIKQPELPKSTAKTPKPDLS